MPEDVSLLLNLRVNDRDALVNAAYAALADYPEVRPGAIERLSNEELADIVVASRVGPWSLIGLELLND